MERRVSFLLAMLLMFLFLDSRVEAQSVQLKDIQSINAVNLHPNGQIIAIGGRVGRQYGFWLYNTSDGSINVIETDYPVLSISWSPDGSRISGAMAGGNASLFQVFATSSKQLLLSFEQGASPSYMLWNDDSTQLATMYSQEIYLRDIASGNIVSTFSISEYTSYSLSAIAWDNSSNQRLYGLIGGEKKIIVWDTANGEVEEELAIPSYADTLGLSPDFRKLAIGTIDGSGQIFILDAFDGTQTALLEAENSKNLYALVWQNDGVHLASFSGDYNGGSISVWNVTTSKQVNMFEVNHFISPDALLLHQDNQVITTAVDGTIIVAPLAVAGGDQIIHDYDHDGSEIVLLDATGSTDDKTIVSYVWTESNAEIAVGVQPEMKLALGFHTITLTVTDSDGATNTDQVTIIVIKCAGG